MARKKIDRLSSLLREVERVIAFDHPQLAARREGNAVVVEGVLSIAPTAAEFRRQGAIAQYTVRIVVPHTFPRTEPKVFETGHAFPHTSDFHVNPSGDCCICPYEPWLSGSADRTFSAYLNGPIRNFFLSQFLRKETGKWPFGERAHGHKGYLDACAELLACESRDEDVDYLLRLLSHDRPKGHWDCPCGSGKPLRNCCSEILAQKANRISKNIARSMRKRLKKL